MCIWMWLLLNCRSDLSLCLPHSSWWMQIRVTSMLPSRVSFIQLTEIQQPSLAQNKNPLRESDRVIIFRQRFLFNHFYNVPPTDFDLSRLKKYLDNFNIFAFNRRQTIWSLLSLLRSLSWHSFLFYLRLGAAVPARGSEALPVSPHLQSQPQHFGSCCRSPAEPCCRTMGCEWMLSYFLWNSEGLYWCFYQETLCYHAILEVKWFSRCFNRALKVNCVWM